MRRLAPLLLWLCSCAGIPEIQPEKDHEMPNVPSIRGGHSGIVTAERASLLSVQSLALNNIQTLSVDLDDGPLFAASTSNPDELVGSPGKGGLEVGDIIDVQAFIDIRQTGAALYQIGLYAKDPSLDAQATNPTDVTFYVSPSGVPLNSVGVNPQGNYIAGSMVVTSDMAANFGDTGTILQCFLGLTGGGASGTAQAVSAIARHYRPLPTLE